MFLRRGRGNQIANHGGEQALLHSSDGCDNE